MSKELKIVYEPHPVTPARKAELRQRGFRVMDARFAPKDVAPAPVAPILPPPPAPAERPKLTLPKKA